MNWKKGISLIVHAAIVALVFYMWYFVSLNVPRRGLTIPRLKESLQWFTTLSNLFQGVVSLVTIAALLGGFDRAAWVRTLRWAGATAIGVTFFTVLFFLGPRDGFPSLYGRTGRYSHLIIPLLSMAAFAALDRSGPLPWRSIVWAMAPLLVYEAAYILNLARHGWLGPARVLYDIYGFASHGTTGAAIAIAVMTVGTGLVAAGLKLLRGPG